MKELIIDILKTQLPMVKPEILSQIADDILELKPANPIDAVEVLNRHCATSTCRLCTFCTPFGCGFKINSIPVDWHFSAFKELQESDNNE